MRRLVPDPGPTSIDELLGAYRPWDDPPADRPHLALNFATTLDGRAAIDGRSGAIGSDTDTAMLVGLRLRFDAVMIGAGTMRKAFAYAGVDENFTSEQFDREWEKSAAKQGDKYQLMEKLIKLPGFRSFDRNFDRLPERMRWLVEKVVHDPEKPAAPKPVLPDDLLATLKSRFTEEVPELQKFAGREFAGWNDYS